MNKMSVIGIVLGGGIIVVDRYFYKLPNRLAIVLLVLACIMNIKGMIMTRKSAG